MSDKENQVENQVNEEAAAPAQAGQRTVTAQAVLLSAVELAQSRGAYRVNEMSLITEAHRIVTAQETARLQAAAGAGESAEGEGEGESAEAESSE